MTFDECEAFFRQSVRALKLFEAASKQKPAMELARLTMLNSLVHTLQARAMDAVKYLPQDQLVEMVERFDKDRRIDDAKAGLINRANPAPSLRQ